MTGARLARVVTAVILAAVTAPVAYGAACEPGQSPFVHTDADHVAVVTGTATDQLALVPPLTGPVDRSLPVWRAGTGTDSWTQTVPAGGRLLALRTDGQLDGTGGDDVSMLHVAEVAGCESLVATARRGSDGALLARHTVTQTRPAGAGYTSLVSHVDGDLTGDGRPDSVVEIRDVAAPAPAQVVSPGGRLVSPGSAVGGRTVVVNGATAAPALGVAHAAAAGPGPMARVARAGSTPVLVTLTNTSVAGDLATVRIAARTGSGGPLWTRTAQTLLDPLDALPVTGGVAFVTTRYDVVALGISPGIPSAARATVVDAATGAVRWTADWPAGAVVAPLGGDLLVHVPGRRTVERRRAGDGAVVWRATYAGTDAVQPRLAGDLTGDGVPDWVVPDTACGPSWFSGADGAHHCHPELAASTTGLHTVPDLDGDGSDDLVAVTYAAAAMVVPASAGVLLSAVNGADGGVLWQVPFPTAQDAVFVVAARVDGVAGPDVVVYRPNTGALALAGRTGAEVWRREPPR